MSTSARGGAALGAVLAKPPAGLSPGAAVPAPREPPTPCCWGYGVSSRGHRPSYVSPGSLPSGGRGDAENSQPLSWLVFLVTSSPPLTKSHPESPHADERGSWWSCHLGVHKSFESSASWGSRWGKGSGDTPKAGHPESPSPTAAHSVHPAPPAPSPSGGRWGSTVPAGSSGSRSEWEAWGAPKATP